MSLSSLFTVICSCLCWHFQLSFSDTFVLSSCLFRAVFFAVFVSRSLQLFLSAISFAVSFGSLFFQDLFISLCQRSCMRKDLFMLLGSVALHTSFSRSGLHSWTNLCPSPCLLQQTKSLKHRNLSYPGDNPFISIRWARRLPVDKIFFEFLDHSYRF